MGRWRPPAEKSSPYITPEGYRALEKELAALWVKRKGVNEALSAAAAEGDRSENAEYIYRKKQQAEIDRRIRYLQKRTPDLKLVDQVGSTEKVFFGAWVELEVDDLELEYRIVGSDETDAVRNFISVDSPLAKGLLGKPLDAEVKVNIGGTDKFYTILGIRYK
ncbi:MAG TPA: transcription elongation factor GreB [Gammaproteobacteria bacterium]|jgi:transcription elongation factor GreB|nr:transcription elongation factor GreB [Pseudomonadota bacterium]HAY45908.1 transcription elongation factor GreB [Gammaproteobacteria bacterium]